MFPWIFLQPPKITGFFAMDLQVSEVLLNTWKSHSLDKFFCSEMAIRIIIHKAEQFLHMVIHIGQAQRIKKIPQG